MTHPKFIRRGGQNLKLLLVLFILPLLHACSIGDWRVYETSEFTVEFPGAVSDTIISEGNTAGARSYFEPVPGALDSNLFYAITMYPNTDSVSGKALYDQFEQDAEIYAWSIGGQVSDSGKVVKSGDVEGREFQVLLANNKGVSTIRKFAFGKHTYTLLVVTDNARINNSAIRRFMNSFKLKKPK